MRNKTATFLNHLPKFRYAVFCFTVCSLGFLLTPAPAIAQLQVQFTDACTDQPLHQTKISLNETTNVGFVTVAVLQKSQLPFVGNARGIHSIAGSPVGDEALEILSNREMRAYGWCFKLDDELSENLPDATKISPDNTTLHWYFAYAWYKDGHWIGQCLPANALKPAFLCK